MLADDAQIAVDQRLVHFVPAIAAAALAPGSAGHPPRLVSCHFAEEIRDGLLFPKSAEEVAATQGVTVSPTGAQGFDSDSPVGGVDQPIERI